MQRTVHYFVGNMISLIRIPAIIVAADASHIITGAQYSFAVKLRPDDNVG